MARNENAPFERGTTFYGGATIDTNDLGGANLEGMEFEFEDLVNAVVGSTKTARSGHKVRCRVVRNNGSTAILPKTITCFSTPSSAATYGTKASGATTAGAVGFPVDELLPAGGVPVGDLFYVVVEGPALVAAPSGGHGAAIAANDALAATATKSVSATIPAGGFIVGRAANAAASGSSTEVLVFVGR
jgi:hypothetical protein